MTTVSEAPILDRDLALERACIHAAVLGADYSGTNRAFESLLSLTPEDFTHPVYRKVFKLMRDLFDRKEPLQARLILSYERELGLTRAEILDAVNWGSGVPDVPVIPYYARRLRQMTARRAIPRTFESIGNVLDGLDIAGHLRELQTQLERASAGTTIAHGKDFAMGLIRLVDCPPMNMYITTGFTLLDQAMSGGFRRQFLSTVGGYSGSGKTVVLFNFAIAAVRSGSRVAFISQEMTQDSMLERTSVVLGGSPPAFISMESLNEVKTELYDWGSRWSFSDRRMSVSEVESFALDVKNTGGLDILFVDYIQLTKADGAKFNSRQQEIADVAERLSALAKRLDCAVVVGAQLSRAAIAEPPELSHLRESGDIENTSRLVILLDRPRYRDALAPLNAIDIAIKKNSQGPLSDKWLRFETIHGFILKEPNQ